ncbi:hypothetical protein EV121DRAFT_262585 [Schizophyllum commune]
MFSAARVSSWLLVLFSALVLVAHAAPLETNAQRFARGLPPLAPSNLRRTGTGTDSADHGHPSAKPPVSYSGRLQARTADGTVVGFVRNFEGAASISGISFGSSDEELHVSFSTSGGYKPFDILATNPNFPAPYYVGAAGTGPLAKGSYASVAFTNVGQTPAGSKPVKSGENSYESAIWTFNPQTKQFTAHFVNPDGSKPKTQLAYDARANELFFVGDLAAYNKQFDYYPAGAVNLYLVD